MRVSANVKFVALVLMFVVIIFGTGNVSGQTETPTPTPTPTQAQEASPTPTTVPQDNTQKKEDLKKQIGELQGKISDLQSKEKTLSSQIKIIDNQIKLSELRIADTEEKIKNLKDDIIITKGKITGLEGDINKSTQALMGRVEGVYRVSSIKPWQVLFTSNSLDNFFTRLKYLKIVQLFDKKNVFAAEQAKVNYQNQQAILVDKQKEEESLKKELDQYNDQLNADKDSKRTLLSQTQGDEANYQRLLSQAKAQLAGFERFVTSQGGASILSGQTKCDEWGCYYNQRDSQWGNSSLNGTQYTLASDGCLVTSMAMVYTHYGHRGVNPSTINSNSSNFASYYPAYLMKRITADGATSDRISTDIDAMLSSGNPVVVGISYDGGGLADHFVVFVSGSSGNYIMHDPFTPNGHNINFRDRYPSVRIVEYEKVVFL